MEMVRGERETGKPRCQICEQLQPLIRFMSVCERRKLYDWSWARTWPAPTLPKELHTSEEEDKGPGRRRRMTNKRFLLSHYAAADFPQMLVARSVVAAALFARFSRFPPI